MTVRASAKTVLLRPWLVSFSGQAVQLVMQAVSFGLLARFLGVEDFGQRVALGAVAAIMTPVVGFGFANLLVRNVARKPETFAESWGNALLLTVVTGALATSVGTVAALLLVPQAPAVHIVGLVLFSDLFCARIVAVAGTAFQALGSMGLMARTGTILQAGRLAAVVACLVATPASSRLAWWAAASAWVSGAATILVLADARRRVGPARLSLARMRAEWREGIHFVLSPYTQVVNNDADKLVLAQFTAPGVVGLYGAAYRVVAATTVPLLSLLNVTYPLFFAHGEQGIRAARRFARTVAAYAIPTGVLAAVTLFGGSYMILPILGSGYGDAAIILRWLCIVPALKAIQFVFADALTGAGLQRRRTAIQAGTALCNVALNVALDPRFGWVGATIATLASESLLAVGLAAGTRRAKEAGAHTQRTAGAAASPLRLEDEG